MGTENSSKLDENRGTRDCSSSSQEQDQNVVGSNIDRAFVVSQHEAQLTPEIVTGMIMVNFISLEKNFKIIEYVKLW